MEMLHKRSSFISMQTAYRKLNPKSRAILAPVIANMPDSAAGSLKVEALCTISNAYTTCHPQINGDQLIINFPFELVVLDKDEVKSIDH